MPAPISPNASIASTLATFSNVFTDAQTEALKDEISFTMNAFNQTQTYSDYIALAFRLRDLLLMERGTNPAAPSMGVGIRNYLMEIADSITLSDLKQAIQSQIDIWLPTDQIVDFTLTPNPQITDRNKVAIIFQLKNTNTQFNSSNAFAITVDGNVTRSGSLVSQIYI
jgi:hypothetical protein